MRSATKIQRAQSALEVINNHNGENYPLGQWITLINDKLSKQSAFRSTKELASTFKYISYVMNIKLERSKHNTFINTLKTCNTYYKFIGEKNGNNQI